MHPEPNRYIAEWAAGMEDRFGPQLLLDGLPLHWLDALWSLTHPPGDLRGPQWRIADYQFAVRWEQGEIPIGVLMPKAR